MIRMIFLGVGVGGGGWWLVAGGDGGHGVSTQHQCIYYLVLYTDL